MTHPTFRVGNGFDVHRLVADRDLVDMWRENTPHASACSATATQMWLSHALSDALLRAVLPCAISSIISPIPTLLL